ncbi:MAG: hypothetical protein Q4F74_05805, partial [Synergistaceae bacterium]|nr:hypothetical protein [Synergistaceae bacterium]
MHDEPLLPGVRVVTPLGSARRVGLVSLSLDSSCDLNSDKLKKIISVIDELPPLPYDLSKTLEWFSSTWFLGDGMAAKTLLPSKFFAGEELSQIGQDIPNTDNYKANYVYDADDMARYQAYLSDIEISDGAALILFSEASTAKKFWNIIPREIRDEGVLWPSTNPSKQWNLWKEAREGKIRFIVGSQAAAFAPLKGLLKIIFDDEASGAWRTVRHPCFHYRSIVAARAKFAGASFILGGRMPSAKAFMQCGETGGVDKGADDRLVFVDLHDSSNFDVGAVKDQIAISKPLMRETYRCGEQRGWAFWLLDRKGYAGEIFCSDCGASVSCPQCGGVMRWENLRARMTCLNCGRHVSIPERCPSCGGNFLEGTRPGLEALAEKAKDMFGRRNYDIMLFQNEGERIPSPKNLLKDHPNGGLIIGTRKILSLADELSPAMIGWLDADVEARTTQYDARAKAFALLYESMWRGPEANIRRVVIQSRRPSRSWQSSLGKGWRSFWTAELKERGEWLLPPYLPMVR